MRQVYFVEAHFTSPSIALRPVRSGSGPAERVPGPSETLRRTGWSDETCEPAAGFWPTTVPCGSADATGVRLRQETGVRDLLDGGRVVGLPDDVGHRRHRRRRGRRRLRHGLRRLGDRRGLGLGRGGRDGDGDRLGDGRRLRGRGRRRGRGGLGGLRHVEHDRLALLQLAAGTRCLGDDLAARRGGRLEDDARLEPLGPHAPDRLRLLHADHVGNGRLVPVVLGRDEPDDHDHQDDRGEREQHEAPPVLPVPARGRTRRLQRLRLLHFLHTSTNPHEGVCYRK